MGYLYDSENQTYVHEAYCDENGYYDPSILSEQSSDVLKKAASKAARRGLAANGFGDRAAKKGQVANSEYLNAKSGSKEEKMFYNNKKKFDKEENDHRAVADKEIARAKKFKDYANYKEKLEKAGHNTKMQESTFFNFNFK